MKPVAFGFAHPNCGNGNTITNGSQGTITTTGALNDGMAANGSNNRLANQGRISTAEPNAYGMTAAWGQTNVGLHATAAYTANLDTATRNSLSGYFGARWSW